MQDETPMNSRIPQWSVEVSNMDQGKRLDVYLSERLAGYSRNQVKQWITQGFILVSGKKVKAGYLVRRGDGITVHVPRDIRQNTLLPEMMDLDILYEDDHIVVVNKSAGVVVHPGAGQESGTLVHGLLAHCGTLAMQGAPLRPGIVHRLDQNTSGALVAAKTEKAYLDLVGQFKSHEIRKTYLAVVYGTFPTKRGEVRTFMGRHPENRKKMAVLANSGREAITHWRVAREWGEVTLLQLRIETGRTHQIRVHMNHLQHPIVGDATYGGGKRRARAVRRKTLQDLLLRVERPMLHAWKLGLRHPMTDLQLSVEAPPPQDFTSLLRELDQLEANGDGFAGME